MKGTPSQQPAISPARVSGENVAIDMDPNSRAARQHANFIDEIKIAIKETNANTILKVMRTINLILSVATIAAGISCWYFGLITSWQTLVSGIYIIAFGAMLLLFELRNHNWDIYLRQYFGFMFHNTTRTMFLFFMAIWPLSMGRFWVTIVVAFCLFLNSLFNYYVILRHPAFTHHRYETSDLPTDDDPPAPAQKETTPLLTNQVSTIDV